MSAEMMLPSRAEIECLDRHAFPGFCSACEALAGGAIAQD